MEGLEAQSWLGDFLDETVILFDNIIETFHAQDFNPLCKTRSNNGPQKRLHIAVVAE